MLSSQITAGQYLWPKPEGTWPNRYIKHIVHATRTVKGHTQFDVRLADEDAQGELIDQHPHWITFTQIRTNFNYHA